MLTFKELKKLVKESEMFLPVLKVALLGDTATQFLATAIKGLGIERGYRIDLFEADYNQIEQQIFDPASDLNAFNAQFVVIFQSTHRLNEKYSLLSSDAWESISDQRIDFVKSVCTAVKVPVIYFNYPEIEDTVFGSYANKVSASFSYQVRKLNYELMNLAQSYQNLFICDLAGLQNKFGRDFIFNPAIYTSTEMILSLEAVPYVASRVMDIIASLQGKVKKCLILDLDNTIWGGIVGDDGLEGIQLGHGLGIGKAFTEFQMWIKKLKNRGIIICICSKNDEAKAKEPFEKHPDMILKLDDISVFMANWESKVDNIRMIQKILNIGFDSMVFLDDNPFERNVIRENITGITVPELPEDPAYYLEYLYTLNLFETASYSVADKDRTKQYQVQAERVAFSKTFANEDDYLKSLNMISKVEDFNSFNIPRVAQLSQRSNQFNLRTVRYSDADIKALSENSDSICMAFSLEDKFGDNGLIAVVIMKKEDSETLFIDTWFMSCRVLKRGMENFTLNKLVSAAKARGYKKIIGEYLPTPKNEMVKEHYSNLGFTKIDNTETARFVLDVDKYENKPCFIVEKN